MVPDVVRRRIRHGIDDGRLPRKRTIELWHGPGFGQTCDACGATIAIADRMILICADEWRTIRFHDDCFQVWNVERRA
jgi:hypothetical protein